MSMVGFPLLLIPLAIYNMIAFLMPGVGFGETIVQLRLVSGETWTVSLGDILLALGVLLLWLEVIKAARPNGRYLTDHLLALLVAAGAAAEFVMWPKFGNSTYFLLALLAMVDFFAGVGLRAKRRRAALANAPVSNTPLANTPSARPQPVPAEPLPEPVTPTVAPAHESVVVSTDDHPAEPRPALETAAVPPAAAVAESVLLDHPDPRLARPAANESSHVSGTGNVIPPAAPDERDNGAEQAPGVPKP